MSYPLIMQPSPLQSLAATVTAIRQERDARLAAAEERRLNLSREARGNAYLALQQRQQAASEMHNAAMLELEQARLNLERERTAANLAAAHRAELRAQQTAWLNQQVGEDFQRRMLGLGDMVNEVQTAMGRNAANIGTAALGGMAGAGAANVAPVAVPSIASTAAAAIADYQPAREGAVNTPERIGHAGNLYYLGGRALSVSDPSAGGRIPPVQLKAAGAALAAMSADADMRAIENSPNGARTMNEVASFIALPAVGRFVPGSPGVAFEELTRNARWGGLSQDAKRYLKRMYDFTSLAGPVRYGRQFRNNVLLNQIWADFGAGQYGAGGADINATQRNRTNAIGQFQAEAGPAALTQAGQYFQPSSSTLEAPSDGINRRFDPRNR